MGVLEPVCPSSSGLGNLEPDFLFSARAPLLALGVTDREGDRLFPGPACGDLESRQRVFPPPPPAAPGDLERDSLLVGAAAGVLDLDLERDSLGDFPLPCVSLSL